MRPLPRRAAALALAACGAPRSSAPAVPPPIELTALAASSLTESLPEAALAWKARGGTAVTFSFDSSSKPARQVEAGAPADLLFTADAETMDAVEARQLLAPGTRRDLLGNSLVVVVPAASAWTPAAPPDLASASLAHLAVAGENVPAGKYARASLDAAGLWSVLEPKVVSGDNVRTTLAWVTRGEAEAGIVYATDAKVEPRVRVAFAFPAESHPPIAYPGAVIAASAHATEAGAFLAFCASPEGQAIFADAGFTAPPGR